jgi:hypothetical protein
MFDVVCDPCGGRVLISTRQIVSMRNGDAGIEVGYVCHCGRVGVRRTGRAASAQRSPAAAMSSNPPSTTKEEPVV